MSTDDPDEMLDAAIADVYRAPLEDFVRRRDALAKELRSAGKREEASVVKALRKPSRSAWALDVAVHERQEAVDSLVAAVGETVDAQSGGGDVRGAIAGLRTAVRELANHAANAAERGGHNVDSGALVNAVFAVLGKTESFDQLRRGRLAEIPEAGGLDLLTALSAPSDLASRPAPAKAARPAAAPGPRAKRTAAPDPSPKRAALEAEARETLKRAAAALARARDLSATAQEALGNVEAKLRAADVRLREAEKEARTLISTRDRARQEADTAAATVREAETTAADAERRLAEIRSEGA